jgi:hypothetical protein
MSVASADRIISFLVEKSAEKSIKSAGFIDAFYNVLLLILLNDTIKTHPVEVSSLTAMNHGITAPGGTGDQTVNIRMYMMFLAHGYVPVDCTDADHLNWTTTYGGQTKKINDHTEKWPTANDKNFINGITSNLYSQSQYWQDKRYVIHCMQKPPFEVPNPVILRTFLGPIDPQSASVDADGSQMLDNQRHHDFAYHLLKYYEPKTGDGFAEQDTVMCKVLTKIFERYQKNAEYMWGNVNSTPASAYMQNSTTELPTLAYHGNLNLDKHKKGHEEIRCVGHLGNSFPGCASIRQGKGMINLYERPPTAIHVI